MKWTKCQHCSRLLSILWILIIKWEARGSAMYHNTITWCNPGTSYTKGVEYNLTELVYCDNHEILMKVTTNTTYTQFSSRLSSAVFSNAKNIKFKHIDRLYFGDRFSKRDRNANYAYTLLKWAVLHLKPNPEDLWLEFGVGTGNSINMTAKIREHNIMLCKFDNESGTSRLPIASTGMPRAATASTTGAGFVIRPIHGFDSFRGLPTKWNRKFQKGSFSLNGTMPPVTDNVQLHVGLFKNTLPTFLEQLCSSSRNKMKNSSSSSSHKASSIAFVNIDMDLYGAALYVLKTLQPWFRRGTILHFHEFFHHTLPGEGRQEALHGEAELKALYNLMYSMAKTEVARGKHFACAAKRAIAANRTTTSSSVYTNTTGGGDDGDGGCGTINRDSGNTGSESTTVASARDCDRSMPAEEPTSPFSLRLLPFQSSFRESLVFIVN